MREKSMAAMTLKPLPLESFNLAVLPKTTHNISWSPDDELAIACDDCVLIYVPDFSLLSTAENGNTRPGYDSPRQYDEAALRFPIAPLKSPELNRHLFDAVGQEFTGYTFFTGGGSGVVTGHGSTLNHTVALGWSPCGLGRMNRSVLAVLTAGGIITVYCQGASEVLGSVKVHGRTARTLRPWIPTWHVGGGFLVPTAVNHEPSDKKEYITAFSWARDTHGKFSLLSYMNDDDEIVLLSVQSKHSSKATPGHPGTWKVLEVARFPAQGPHPIVEKTDPDYAYNGSSFALSWSPWLDRGSSKTSIISYVAHNYIGFRQITIDDGGDEDEEALGVQVGRVDASGVCLYLSSDAFVVWEDKIWMRPGSNVCRGVIASPSKVQAFELPFDYTSPMSTHKTDRCGTTYPSEEDMMHSGNPITGLIVHPPSTSQDASTPAYTLVRLSATHDNPTWHQTNVPEITPHYNTTNLNWATEISQTIEHQLPRALARRQQPSPGTKQDATSFSSDELDSSDMDESTDYESEFSQAEDENPTKTKNVLGIRGLDISDQVHLNRIRIWGMTRSPGGGTSAVFTSQHSTLELERDTFAGLKCRVLFGVHPSPPLPELSTEAKAWEWMYASGPPVPGYSGPGLDDEREVLRDQFRTIAKSQLCVFCGLGLVPSGNESRCINGHVFENCANTNVPVLAPNISHTCGVCGMKCLKAEELYKIAPRLKDIIDKDISEEHCGGCGGKFSN
ncbi:hypothetical protein GGS20DRAFT_532570 [Poronia punctata]|nr:hypothetical protein GGS20DRAFT_532570 [Poronia punctata]